MWNYEKRLEYPINIKQTNPQLAAMIISQYGGPYSIRGYEAESRINRAFAKIDLWDLI